MKKTTRVPILLGRTIWAALLALDVSAIAVRPAGNDESLGEADIAAVDWDGKLHYYYNSTIPWDRGSEKGSRPVDQHRWNARVDYENCVKANTSSWTPRSVKWYRP